MNIFKHRTLLTMIIILMSFFEIPMLAQTFNIADGGVINSCSGSIFDSGGADNDYGPNENFIVTVCSNDPTLCPQITAQLFIQDDILNVYDGPDTSFPLVVVLTGSDLLFPTSMTNGCFTLEFISNGVVEDSGFEVVFSCVNSCTSCDDGAQNGDETGVDCGGACPPCLVASPQDCIGAQPICDYIIEQPIASSTEGDFPNEVGPGTCLVGGEANSLWYIFTMGTDGNLSFAIEPDDLADDYDWILYDITNSSCENIATDPSLLVSCNSYGEFGTNGPTGISSSSGGTGTSNGPGNTNGPPFNADEPVSAGDTFVLLISDWSSTPDGYTLDFSESTAELFDITEPTITDIAVNCEEIQLTFSENIDCTSLDFNDFQLMQNTDVYNVSSISSICNSGQPFANQISLSFTPDIPANGDDFTFSVVGGFGSVTDMCGNQAALSDTTLVINIGISMDVEITASTCNEADGMVEIINVSGGIAPYTFTLNGISQLSMLFENLESGDYNLIVEDDEGCSTSQLLTISGQNGIDYVIGNDAISCEMNMQLAAETSPGFSGLWTAHSDIIFSDASLPTTNVVANSPGSYFLTWTIDDDAGCIMLDSIEVFFTDIMSEIEVNNALCSGVCDGSASANSIEGGEGPYDCSWSGGVAIDGDCSVTNLCPGTYSMEIIDAHNCQNSFDFSVVQTSFFEIDSVVGINETCKDYCDGIIEIYAQDGVQFSVDGGNSFNTNPSFDNLCDGQYEIIARDINNCEDENFATITFPSPPYANFTVTNPSMIWSNPVFEVVNHSNDYISSVWEFGYPNSLIISTLDNPTFELPNSEIGDYIIQLIVEDDIGCTDSTYRTVTVKDDLLIYIPNSFTPNEDGLNDLFYPLINDVDPDSYDFSIFDRYGHLVFQTTDPRVGWNGSGKVNKNYYSPNGVYNWQISFKANSSSERITQNGSITLIR